MDPLTTAWTVNLGLTVIATLLFDHFILIPTIDAWRRFLRRRAVDAWHQVRHGGHAR